ncbi:thioredoxin domain-containing protein [Rhodocytophaga rosea]|uniref:Thioredoxin domain-containing protein n=1 Tax=Rhodocytophaga rosea TaxID=2704465 RepID=A0A6C0GH81_9BACT|nr:thioredoxin domain-containing protein [Rhodocytophaga rosea]QHT67174.1 thioredoxin domain-containing protein [Rhodocytophaga rosea]
MSSHFQKEPNKLANETSPYLLQHAYNPVQWYPWGEEALQKAKTEDKPIIVSIGYSACHWCHVMERESFENEQIAKIMNEHFVAIKVDREERPDVDAIYMDAIQAMGIQGGWPLNVFLTPEAKPFYGSTYFPPRNWAQMLLNVAEAYKTNKGQLLESAEQFTEHLGFSDIQKYQLSGGETTYSVEELSSIFSKLAAKFDRSQGGMNKAPKFPMPSIYLFLLRYFKITKDEQALAQVKLTLDKMALGGIYDQIGGGFARYSVDAEWFAPHFEKMLYDNGQLISLYSEAYTCTQHELYKDVVYQTIDFAARELRSEEGGFYSALDADSEGEEGKFYVWTYADWQEALNKIELSKIDKKLFETYYHIEPEGNWEHGNNILFRTDETAFAQANNIDPVQFKKAHHQLKTHMLQERAKRIHPGLDDKILCSWNGLMLKGLVEAYQAFGEPLFLELALQNARFVLEKMRKGNQLYHSYKNGKATITGYLEDYAFVIEGLLALYQATFTEEWLTEARNLTKYVIDNFYDAEEQMFFFTDANAEKLIARKKELFDNVIPSSNSAMAKNLYLLGLLLDKPAWLEISEQMLARAKKIIVSDPQYLSNWAVLLAHRTQPTAEVAIVGPKVEDFRREISTFYFPNKVLTGTTEGSDLPLLEGREAIGSKTTIYVCYNRTCQLPVFSIQEAVKQLQEVLY